MAAHSRSREALDQELGDRVRAGPHFAEGVSAFLEEAPPGLPLKELRTSIVQTACQEAFSRSLPGNMARRASSSISVLNS